MPGTISIAHNSSWEKSDESAVTESWKEDSQRKWLQENLLASPHLLMAGETPRNVPEQEYLEVAPGELQIQILTPTGVLVLLKRGRDLEGSIWNKYLDTWSYIEPRGSKSLWTSAGGVGDSGAGPSPNIPKHCSGNQGDKHNNSKLTRYPVIPAHQLAS